MVLFGLTPIARISTILHKQLVMLCHYTVLALVYAATCAKCGPSESPETSREALQQSGTSDIRQTLNTFNTLNDIQAACEQPNGPAGMDSLLYCDELIKEGNGYTPLKRVIASKMSEIRTKLTKLLALEKKAVVCRGMRHLLPIIMYGVFIDNLLKGDGIVGAADIFADLFTTVESEEDDEKPIWREEERSDGRVPKESVGDETRAGFAEKIKKLVQVVRLFAGDQLDGVNEMFESTTAAMDAKSYRRRLLFAFRAINGSYRAECFPGYVDTAALLTANRAERNVDHAIRLLVKAADRVFATARDDFAVLCVKFFPVIHADAPMDVPILYYHVFNKCHDRDAWPLIGDEIIVDGSSSMTLNGVVPRDEREINATADGLARSARDTVKCRCFVYVNLMTKLYANTVRALLANGRGIRRLRSEAAFGGSGVSPRTEDELRAVFQWYHDRMKGFQVDGLWRGFGDPDAVSTAIDDGPEDDHAFAVYSMYNVWSIGEAVDAVAYHLDYLGDAAFETELTAMLSDMDDAVRHDSSRRKAVIAALTKWRERGERAYRDICFDGNNDADAGRHPTTLNDAMRRVLRPDDETAPITLDWLIAMIDDLNRRLEDDLRSSGRFNI